MGVDVGTGGKEPGPCSSSPPPQQQQQQEARRNPMPPLPGPPCPPLQSLAPHRLQVTPGMSVPAFLAAAEGLITPLDAYFEKVFVMCDNEVS